LDLHKCFIVESVDIPTHVYAEVHFGKNKKKNKEAKEGRQLDNKLSASTPNIAANFDPSIDIEIDENPPVPCLAQNSKKLLYLLYCPPQDTCSKKLLNNQPPFSKTTPLIRPLFHSKYI
jgi:hypothetical protein